MESVKSVKITTFEVLSLDWKAFFVTFGIIFLAELGDKTQLTTMMLAADSSSPVAVFLGAAVALVLSSLMGVLVGSYITKIIPQEYITMGAGVAFVVLGLLLITRKI